MLVELPGSNNYTLDQGISCYREFLWQDIVAKSIDGAEEIKGRVEEAMSPFLQVACETPFSLAVGAQLSCAIGNGVDFARLEGTVERVGDDQLSYSLHVQAVYPGVERAPRAVAPGTVLRVFMDDQEFSASLRDCSESGLRVRSMECVEVETVLKVEVETSLGLCVLQTRVARRAGIKENGYCELGLEILEADRLSRARWNHMVASLLARPVSRESAA